MNTVLDYMPAVPHWAELAVGFLLAIAVTVHVLLRKRDVYSAVGWIGLSWFAPFFGAAAYFILGVNRVQRRARRLRQTDSKAGLRGARLGVCRSHFTGYSPATDALFEEALAALKRLGAVLVDPADIATAGQFDDSELTVLLYEFKADLNRYLAEWAPGAAVRTLADLIAFNERAKDTELPFFGQELFVQAQAKGPLSDQEYLRALDKNRLLARLQGIDAVLAEQRLDALVAPTGGPPSLIDLVNGDPGGGGSFSSPAAVAGYPHVTVPMGYVRGLPVGLSFVGRPWSEGTLIKFAYAYEQATRVRRPPRLLATVDLGA